MTEKLRYGLVVSATAYFECDKPDGWDDWTAQKQADYFMDKAESPGEPCHYCSRKIHTDCEPVDEAYDYLLEELEFDRKVREGF